MGNGNQTQKTITSWVAIGIASISLLFSGYATFRDVGKENIEIKAYDYVALWLFNERVVAGPQIAFKNYGKSTGAISSLEAFIVSTSTDNRTPKYMRLFSDVGTRDKDSNKWYPFLGYFIYPNESLQFDFNVYQKEATGYGSFESGMYEYLVTLTNDKGEIIRNLYYEFHIDESQVRSILGGNTEYIQLTPLQEDREKNLLSIFESFKSRKIGNDDNDLKSGYTATVTFDSNGGTGGKSSQFFIAGRGQALDGGTPTRSGYQFSHWNTNQEGTGVMWQNGKSTTVGWNRTIYAVWYKDFGK